MGEQAAVGAQQRLEEVVLAGGEVHGGAADAHLVALHVERDRADGDDRGETLLGAAAAQCRTDAGQELADGEGFFHVVVGAGVQCCDLVGLAVAGGEHDHGNRVEGAQPREDLDAVEVGQAEIEQDEVGGAAGGEAEAFAGVLGLEELVARGTQGRFEKAVDLGLVVDGEDCSQCHGRGVTRAPWAGGW